MSSETHDFAEPFERLPVDQVKRLIDARDVQIVDVREPQEWATGYLPGSVLIPLNSLLDRSDELDRDRDLLFVCAVGVRSALAAEMAAAVGRTRLYNVEGGIEAWVAAGYPLER